MPGTQSSSSSSIERHLDVVPFSLEKAPECPREITDKCMDEHSSPPSLLVASGVTADCRDRTEVCNMAASATFLVDETY
jgi:hypothetical protein